MKRFLAIQEATYRQGLRFVGKAGSNHKTETLAKMLCQTTKYTLSMGLRFVV